MDFAERHIFGKTVLRNVQDDISVVFGHRLYYSMCFVHSRVVTKQKADNADILCLAYRKLKSRFLEN